MRDTFIRLLLSAFAAGAAAVPSAPAAAQSDPILQRRTKNNPVLIGDEEVPETLKGKRALSLDMAALLAAPVYSRDFPPSKNLEP